MEPSGELEPLPIGAELVAQADLSPEDRAGISDYLLASLAPETRRAYATLLRQYFEWCGQFERCPLPADEETVAAYLNHMARNKGLRPASVKLTKSAISTIHERGRHANPTKSELVRDVIRGIDRKHQAGRVKRARAATGEEILAMASRSDRLVDKRDAAILLVGFGAAMRRSEIVALDVEDIHRDRRGRTVVHIARSKTDQTGRGWDAVLPEEAAEAAWRWLSSAGLKTGPLFRRMARGKTGEEGKPTSHRLTGHAVREILRRRALEVGLDEETGPRWSAHSLRRGAATEADANGATELAIKRLGRWKSMATVGMYVDDNKEVGDLDTLLGLVRKVSEVDELQRSAEVTNAVVSQLDI